MARFEVHRKDKIRLSASQEAARAAAYSTLPPHFLA
jgi:hypothetical protein